MTLFLFAIQVGTGALLLLYYRPSAAEAYESVQFIVTRVPVRLAGAIDSRLVRQPDGGERVRPPVQRAVSSRVPAAARS